MLTVQPRDYARSMWWACAARPEYIDDVTEDDDGAALGLALNEGGDALYDQAVALICRERKASTSFIQRHLQIGYNRSGAALLFSERTGAATTYVALAQNNAFV